MVTDSKVGLPADGVGKSVRNVSCYVLVDGVATLVQMQVLGGIADPYGKIVDPDLKPVLDEILAEQRQTRTLFQLLTDALTGGGGGVAGLRGRTTLGPAASPFSLVDGVADPFGRQITIPWGARDLFVPALPATITDTTSHTLLAGVPDTFLDLVMLIITNTSTATNARVDVSDGTNVYPWMSIGGAGPVGFSSGGLIIPASKKGADWTIIASAAVTDLRVTALFVRNK